jgi:hypothetical protein
MIATGLVNDVAYGQLSMKTTKAILGQSLFLALALVIPTITHRLGLNYLVAQPMHWMILFAGLTYGSFSGLILGALIPLVSFIISGMPVPAALPLMIPELAVYGFVTGLLKQKITGFGSVAAGLIAGKLVFLALIAVTGTLHLSVMEIVRTTWAPGLIAIVFQIALLPVLSGLYIKAVKD